MALHEQMQFRTGRGGVGMRLGLWRAGARQVQRRESYALRRGRWSAALLCATPHWGMPLWKRRCPGERDFQGQVN